MLDLIALFGLYLAGMFYTTNISVDQFWWWWVIHLWVEATWEVLVGCILAYALIKTLGARREIIETWLYVEVALMFGSGILGLGHHYFWIGTPDYWLSIGGFFSALEPIPLVAMVVHAVYDSGMHKMRNNNHPAFAWIKVGAFLLLQTSLLASIVALLWGVLRAPRNGYADTERQPPLPPPLES